MPNRSLVEGDSSHRLRGFPASIRSHAAIVLRCRGRATDKLYPATERLPLRPAVHFLPKERGSEFQRSAQPRNRSSFDITAMERLRSLELFASAYARLVLWTV